jgi:hypothetical protein
MSSAMPARSNWRQEAWSKQARARSQGDPTACPPRSGDVAKPRGIALDQVAGAIEARRRALVGVDEGGQCSPVAIHRHHADLGDAFDGDSPVVSTSMGEAPRRNNGCRR